MALRKTRVGEKMKEPRRGEAVLGGGGRNACSQQPQGTCTSITCLGPKQLYLWVQGEMTLSPDPILTFFSFSVYLISSCLPPPAIHRGPDEDRTCLSFLYQL